MTFIDVYNGDNNSGAKSVPAYEYKCESNGRVVEVSRKMAKKVKTWGDLSTNPFTLSSRSS